MPYKIGAIRGILTNLVNNLQELQFKTKTSSLSSTDVGPAFSMFNDLQKSTAGLCRYVLVTILKVTKRSYNYNYITINSLFLQRPE